MSVHPVSLPLHGAGHASRPHDLVNSGFIIGQSALFPVGHITVRVSTAGPQVAEQPDQAEGIHSADLHGPIKHDCDFTVPDVKVQGCPPFCTSRVTSNVAVFVPSPPH